MVKNFTLADILNPLRYKNGNPFLGIRWVVSIDPESAQKMILSENEGGLNPRGQRRLDIPSAQKHAATMLKGAWDMDASELTLCYIEDENALLIANAQHRLKGIALTGKPQQMAISVVNRPNRLEFQKLMQLFDGPNQRRRTPSDRMSIAQFSEGILPFLHIKVAAAIRVAKIGLTRGSGAIEFDDMAQWMKLYKPSLYIFQNIIQNSPYRHKFKETKAFPIWNYLTQAAPLAVQLEILRTNPVIGEKFLTAMYSLDSNQWFPILVDKRLDSIKDALRDLERGRGMDINSIRYDTAHSHSSKEGRYVLKVLEYTWNKFYDNQTNGHRGRNPEIVKILSEHYIQPFNFHGTCIDGSDESQKLLRDEINGKKTKAA